MSRSTNLIVADVDAINGRIKAIALRLFQNRVFLYLFGITALIGIIVVGGISFTGHPEFANAASTGAAKTFSFGNFTQSPAGYRDSLSSMSSSNAMNLLMWNRWHGSNTLPSPNVGILNIGAMASAGLTIVGSLLLSIASTIMWLVGLLLAMAINLNLLSRLSVTIDHSFALVTSNLLAGSSILGLLLLILLSLTVFNFARGQGRKALLGFGIGAAAIFALIGMSTQANQNHNDQPGGNKSPIAAMSTTPTKNSPGIVTAGLVDTEKASNWAAFSPGWLIAEMNVVLKGATGVVTGAINSVTTAVGTDSINGASSSMCGRYITAMHDTYNSIPAVKANGNMGILESYDNLVQAVYFQPYVMAAYGSSNGAQNAWCRIAESRAGVAPGEQAYLSHKAGLYSELVGWTNASFQPTTLGSGAAQTVVTPTGAWRDSKSSGYAADFFGVNNYTIGAGNKAANYFAACTWGVNGKAKLNPEWDKVLSANFSVLGAFNPFDLGAKIGVADGTNGMMNDQMCQKVALAGYQEFGFNGSSAHSATQFAFTENIGTAIFTGFGVIGTFAANFAPAIIAGNLGGYNYYTTTQGTGSFFALLYGFIILIILGMMARYILPLILGGIVAQVLATVALMFLPITIILMIVPATWSRKLFGITGLSVISAYLVNMLFLAVATVTLMIIHVLMYIFAPASAVQGVTEIVTGGVGTIIPVLQVGLAVFLGLKVVRMMLTKVFAIDMSNFGKAAMSAGLLSGGAVLVAAGFHAPKLLNRIPDAGRGPNDLAREARSRVGNGLSRVTRGADVLDRMRRGPADAAADLATKSANGLGDTAASATDLADVTGTSSVKDAATAVGSPTPAVAPATTATPTGKPGEGINAVINPVTDSSLTAGQHEAANQQILNVSNGLLAPANDDQVKRIMQPGERGDLAALGTTPERLHEVLANNEVPAFATNSGASPFTTKEAAAANWAEAIARGAEAIATPQFQGMTRAERILTRSALSPQPIGVDEKGNLIDIPNTGVHRSSEGYQPDPMLPGNYNDSSASNPRDIPMIFEAPYLSHEAAGPSGAEYWNKGEVAALYSDFGPDPKGIFQWSGREYDLASVVQSMPGLSHANEIPDTLYEVPTIPAQLLVMAPAEKEHWLRKVADLGRGHGFEHDVARWFDRTRRRW